MSKKLSTLVKNYGIEAESDEALLAESGVEQPEMAEDEYEDEHQSLDEVREAQGLSENLGQLQENVEEAPEQASVEHYHWMMDTLLKNAGMPKAKTLALENFTGTGSGKAMLAKSIKSYNSKLQQSIALALEAYTGNYASKLAERAEELEEELRGLSVYMRNVPTQRKDINIHLTSFVKLFFRNNKLIEDKSEFSKEVTRIKELTDSAVSTIDAITKKLKAGESLTDIKLNKEEIELLYNRQVKVTAEGIKVNSRPFKFLLANLVTDFKKSWANIALLAMAIAGGVVFSGATKLAGFLVSLGFKTLATYTVVRQDQSNKKDERYLKTKVEILEALNSFSKGADTVKKINNSVEALALAISKAETDDAKSARRTAAPAIEVLNFVTKHYLDIIGDCRHIAWYLEKY